MFKRILFCSSVLLQAVVVPAARFGGQHLTLQIDEFRSPVDSVLREAGPLNYWKPHVRTSGEEVIEVRVALRQPGLLEAEKLALEVSDPTHSSYGQHLTVQELAAILGTTSDSVEEVKTWLVEGGALSTPELAPTGDYLTVSLHTDAAEKLFKTELWHFNDEFDAKDILDASLALVSATPPKPRKSIVRASPEHGYQLPAAIHKHVDLVIGLADYPPVVHSQSHRIRSAPDQESVGKPVGTVTPSLIWETYNLPKGTPVEHPSSQGVAEFSQEYFYPSDIPFAEKRWGVAEQNATIIGVNDPNDDGAYLGEASLDVEYIIATAPGNPTTVFSFGAYDLVHWALNVTAQPDPPKVHSISYGSGEHVYKLDLLTRTNTEFMKLGLLGLSVLTASGDNGPGSQGFLRCKKLAAYFPASSPWVTAVGGTYVDATSNDEVAWASSGGGFSSTFGMKSWQQKQVSAYLASSAALPDADLYNKTGRALPDISAMAVNYEVCIEGYCSGTVSGTSASSPVVAAMITTINGARIAAGKKALGFLNPWLYSLKTVGRDISSGASSSWPCKKGWPAVNGWDAVTGLGVPDFKVLMAAGLDA